MRTALALFIAIPPLALLAAVPVAWGWGPGWRDVVVGVMDAVAGHTGVGLGRPPRTPHAALSAT